MLTSRLAFVYFFSMLLVCLFRGWFVCCLLGLATKADTRNEWRVGEGGARRVGIYTAADDMTSDEASITDQG